MLGMGGIGKTTITASVAETIAETAAESVAHRYDLLLWRSLLNAPTLDEILRDWLGILLANPLHDLPERLDAQLALLMQHLQERRCLLVLDNLESIFQADHAGQMRPDYAGYLQLFQQVAEVQHQSCLVLTSREQVQEIARLEEALPWVRTLRLEGVDAVAAQTLLVARGLAVQPPHAAALVNRYSGNPLALKLVTETIQDLFGGNIEAFLATDAVIFDDIRSVLEQQFSRLPALEQEILLWLAVEREPVSLETLRDNLAPVRPMPEVVQALRALQRRSLLQRINRNQSTDALADANSLQTETRFAAPNVIMEYLIDRLVQAVCHEIEHEQMDWLHAYSLMQAQAKEYVRQSQVRLILQPIASHLEALLGRNPLRRRTVQLLASLRDERAHPFAPRTYAAGNLLNLLLLMEVDVRGFDLSGLSVWQADLRHANLADVNFNGADLTRSRFADAFGIVLTVAVSPDDTIIAAGTTGGEIRLWDAASGQLLHIYKGHKRPVRSIAFRPDGKTLASGSEDQRVRLWRVEGVPPADSPAEIAPVARILEGHTGRVLAVAFHPNGTMLATASSDHTLRLWDLVSGETRAVLKEHEHPVWGLAFSPDGRTLASSDTNGAICLWDLQTTELRATLHGHISSVFALAFDPKGRWLASGGYDRTVCLWDVSQVASGTVIHEKQHTLEVANDVITSIAFSPDGSLLAVGGDDRIIRLLETESWASVHQLHGHSDAICGFAFSPDGQTLVSGGVDHIVCLWDIHRARLHRILSGYSQRVNSLAYHPAGNLLAAGYYDHCVRVWDTKKQTVRQTLYGHTLSINAVAFNPDGTLLASASDDKTIQVWTMPPAISPTMPASQEQTIRRRFHLRGHQRDVTGVAFRPNGTQLLSSSEDQTVGVWELEEGQPSYFQVVDEVPIWSVRINDAGTVIAIITDYTIRLWNANVTELYKELQGHAAFIWSIAFSPEGQWLACGGSDGSVALWDIHDPQQAHLKTTLHAHAERVFTTTFSPDGKFLASGGADHTVCLWDMQTHQLVHTFKGHTHWIFALAFSPDGRTLASGGVDETIRLWDTHSGEPVAVLHSPGPYARMDISGATGLSDAERTTLKQLGAIEQ